MTQHTQGRLYIRTNRHPNTDGTPWGWVDLYEPGSMRQASPDGIQVTWSRGQKSEANARRLVACWNACEMVSTEDLEALTRPADVSWACTIDRLVRERDELLAALREARRWIGDGECSDGLAREYWTPEYINAVDSIDAALKAQQEV